MSDFADGLLRICERAEDSQPTNLGADEETTIAETARLIAEIAGTGKVVRFDASKPEGQPRRRCDTSRLERIYDFHARVPFAEGLRATVDYFRKEVLPHL